MVGPILTQPYLLRLMMVNLGQTLDFVYVKTLVIPEICNQTFITLRHLLYPDILYLDIFHTQTLFLTTHLSGLNICPTWTFVIPPNSSLPNICHTGDDVNCEQIPIMR